MSCTLVTTCLHLRPHKLELLLDIYCIDHTKFWGIATGISPFFFLFIYFYLPGDCTEGLHCRSTFSPHYKRYSHTLLANTRSYGSEKKNQKEESTSNKDVSVKKHTRTCLRISDSLSFLLLHYINHYFIW